MEVQELLARQHRIDTGIGETVLEPMLHSLWSD